MLGSDIPPFWMFVDELWEGCHWPMTSIMTHELFVFLSQSLWWSPGTGAEEEIIFLSDVLLFNLCLWKSVICFLLYLCMSETRWRTVAQLRISSDRQSGIFLIRQGNALHLDDVYIISNYCFKCVGLLSASAFCVIHPTPLALEMGTDECVFVCADKKYDGLMTQQILFASVCLCGRDDPGCPTCV